MCLSAKKFGLVAALLMVTALGIGCQSYSSSFRDDGDDAIGTHDDGDSAQGEGEVDAGTEDGFDNKLDQDCDGQDANCCDQDGDGYESEECGGHDCDDNDPNIHPGAADICDGRDNDCDGSIDENSMCQPGDIRECSNNIGECRIGTQECQEGCFWGECSGVLPTEEMCDGLDKDCDGDVDCDDIDCASASYCTRECGTDGTSTLPGVSIGFPQQTCVFSLAQAADGIEVSYHLTVEEDLPGVISPPMDAGLCGSPDVGGLHVMEYLGGNDQAYCVCDIGLCQPQEWHEGTLSAGVHLAVFSWDGRNWYGPSDTMNPKGDPFPVGEYTLNVISVGTRVTSAGETVGYEVLGTFRLYLVP